MLQSVKDGEPRCGYVGSRESYQQVMNCRAYHRNFIAVFCHYMYVNILIKKNSSTRILRFP